METSQGSMARLNDHVFTLQHSVNLLSQNCQALEEGFNSGDDTIQLIETMLFVGKSIESVRSQVKRINKALGAVAQEIFS